MPIESSSSSNRKYSSLNVLMLAGVKPYQAKVDEEYMNNRQIMHFKRILETWKNQLKSDLKQLTSINNKNYEIFVNFPDPIDRATQEEEFNIKLRNRDREHKLIEKIEKTLKKIDMDDFGFCELCDVEIGIRRLEASPVADLCIDCKTLEEIREKQMTG